MNLVESKFTLDQVRPVNPFSLGHNCRPKPDYSCSRNCFPVFFLLSSIFLLIQTFGLAIGQAPGWEYQLNQPRAWGNNIWARHPLTTSLWRLKNPVFKKFCSFSRLTASNCTQVTVLAIKAKRRVAPPVKMQIAASSQDWTTLDSMPHFFCRAISNSAMQLKRSAITEQPQFRPYHTFYWGCFQRGGAERFWQILIW